VYRPSDRRAETYAGLATSRIHVRKKDETDRQTDTIRPLCYERCRQRTVIVTCLRLLMKVNVKTIIYREYYYNFARTRTEQMLPLIIAGDIAAAVTSVMLLLIARRLRRSTSSVSCMCRQHPRTYLSLDVARSADDSYPAFDLSRDDLYPSSGRRGYGGRARRSDGGRSSDRTTSATSIAYTFCQFVGC